MPSASAIPYISLVAGGENGKWGKVIREAGLKAD